MLDIQLEIEHLVYIFITSITWLLITFWGRAQYIALYNPIPAIGQLIITISFWIGGAGMLIGILLVLYTVFE
ncbi:MAG: hypothetical protein ACTSWC_03175 [Promethearchaeota archaeon]